MMGKVEIFLFGHERKSRPWTTPEKNDLRKIPSIVSLNNTYLFNAVGSFLSQIQVATKELYDRQIGPWTLSRHTWIRVRFACFETPLLKTDQFLHPFVGVSSPLGVKDSDKAPRNSKFIFAMPHRRSCIYFSVLLSPLSGDFIKAYNTDPLKQSRIAVKLRQYCSIVQRRLPLTSQCILNVQSCYVLHKCAIWAQKYKKVNVDTTITSSNLSKIRRAPPHSFAVAIGPLAYMYKSSLRGACQSCRFLLNVESPRALFPSPLVHSTDLQSHSDQRRKRTFTDHTPRTFSDDRPLAH